MFVLQQSKIFDIIKPKVVNTGEKVTRKKVSYSDSFFYSFSADTRRNYYCG